MLPRFPTVVPTTRLHRDDLASSLLRAATRPLPGTVLLPSIATFAAEPYHARWLADVLSSTGAGVTALRGPKFAASYLLALAPVHTSLAAFCKFRGDRLQKRTAAGLALVDAAIAEARETPAAQTADGTPAYVILGVVPSASHATVAGPMGSDDLFRLFAPLLTSARLRRLPVALPADIGLPRVPPALSDRDDVAEYQQPPPSSAAQCVECFRDLTGLAEQAGKALVHLWRHDDPACAQQIERLEPFLRNSPWELQTLRSGALVRPVAIAAGQDGQAATAMTVGGFLDDPFAEWLRGDVEIREFLERFTNVTYTGMLGHVASLVADTDADPAAESRSSPTSHHPLAVVVGVPPLADDLYARAENATSAAAFTCRGWPGCKSAIRSFGSLARQHKNHKRVVPEPHYYIWQICADASARGQGLGSAIMSFVTTAADITDTWAYLENSKADNLTFYARHGFLPCGKIPAFGAVFSKAPVFWPSPRAPRSHVAPEAPAWVTPAPPSEGID
eukprot:gnl/Ergobibamus_cyprinoides/328.p1 GENE.gnl/Ergobibamus_cyprinoides/328~~gnl/Ergobibamus_cyprinoides/328.p1  ORF type:complete len:527 (-),score=104.26 gnl/Ergobibamus_cyprinoides/328:52-1569(-)